MPTPFGRDDAICLVAGAAGMLLWTVRPGLPLAGPLLILAGALHLVRLARWRGWATWRSPLLLMLHVAYLLVPVGLLATGAAAFGVLPPAAAAHLLGIGAVGGMTVAVMMRATRGHTGRDLVAGGWLTGAFALVVAAALTRALAARSEFAGIDGISLSAGLWMLGFAIFTLRLAPWLSLPNAAPRQANR